MAPASPSPAEATQQFPLSASFPHICIVKVPQDSMKSFPSSNECWRRARLSMTWPIKWNFFLFTIRLCNRSKYSSLPSYRVIVNSLSGKQARLILSKVYILILNWFILLASFEGHFPVVPAESEVFGVAKLQSFLPLLYFSSQRAEDWVRSTMEKIYTKCYGTEKRQNKGRYEVDLRKFA